MTTFTQDEIIEMAREAGLEVDGVYFSDTMYRAVLVRFANLVAAKEQKKWQDQTAVEIHEAVLEEREACALICDDHHEIWRFGEGEYSASGPKDCAAAIRVRGEA
jgi:hypothetical protein